MVPRKGLRWYLGLGWRFSGDRAVPDVGAELDVVPFDLGDTSVSGRLRFVRGIAERASAEHAASRRHYVTRLLARAGVKYLRV